MSTNVTVDSFVKFQYKKKFSFANRNVDTNNKPNNETTSSSEDEKSKNNHQPKGSAKLKQKKIKKNSSSSFSASFSSTSNSDSDTKSKKKKKKSQKKKDSASDDEDEKRNEKLKKLFRMFPKISIHKIEAVWQDNNYNAKKCIDLLLAKKSDSSVNDKSLEIEEWSDGDETIRAKNLEKKRKSDAYNKLNEPLKKKARKIIIASDDDDDIDGLKSNDNKSVKSNESSRNKCSSSSLSSSLNSSTEKQAKNSGTKIKKKTFCIQSSSDDESSNKNSKSTATVTKKSDEDDASTDGEKSKKHKKSKKEKKSSKKHKKKKHMDNSNDEFEQEDDDFDRDNAGDNSSDSDDDELNNLTDEQKAAILTIFNNSSTEDIQSMINVSAKKLKTLLSLRPFENYLDLHNRFKEKSLIKYIESAKEIIYARGIVNNLLAKCENISRKMEKQVADLISENSSSSNEDSNPPTMSSKLEIKTQPKSLNKALSLKPYQLIGLNWLCLMHKEGLNGILADEMGLGKTCQTIAFMAYLLEKNPKQLHLIVVPPSTLDNWVREISVWLPSFYFTVYQGSLDERRHLRYDVLNNKFEKPLNAILTTYGLLSSSNEDKAFFRKLKLEYCIFDEAHMLKNMNSIRYQSLIKITSKRKLLLTGTPLQNNLVELMSLLYFVMPDIFHHKTEYLNRIFKSKPSNIDVDTFYNEKITQAKGIMKPFILRRVKTEVLKQLPKKTEEIIHCDMAQRQQKDYNNLIDYYKKRKDQLLVQLAEKANQEKAKKDNKNNKDGNKFVSEEIFEILEDDMKKQKKADMKIKETEDSSSNIVMELRKMANHPLLRRSIYDEEKLKTMAKLIMKESSPETVYEYVLEDMSVMSDFQLHKLCPLYKCLKDFQLDDKTILSSGKFAILNSILEEKKELGDRVLIFSQFVIMLDIIEEFLKIKSHKFVRLDGSTAVSDRQDLIDLYNNDSEIFIFLLSTKAGGMGINLTAANVVIMHDIDFNPFNDKQAEDRCHRVGQTKEVQIYKLISKNSIDETMLKIQQKKLALGSDINGENDENQSKKDMVSLLKEALNT